MVLHISLGRKKCLFKIQSFISSCKSSFLPIIPQAKAGLRCFTTHITKSQLQRTASYILLELRYQRIDIPLFLLVADLKENIKLLAVRGRRSSKMWPNSSKSIPAAFRLRTVLWTEGRTRAWSLPSSNLLRFSIGWRLEHGRQRRCHILGRTFLLCWRVSDVEVASVDCGTH